MALRLCFQLIFFIDLSALQMAYMRRRGTLSKAMRVKRTDIAPHLQYVITPFPLLPNLIAWNLSWFTFIWFSWIQFNRDEQSCCNVCMTVSALVWAYDKVFSSASLYRDDMASLKNVVYKNIEQQRAHKKLSCIQWSKLPNAVFRIFHRPTIAVEILLWINC